MAGSVDYGSLPFNEQIEFFRQKINLPSASWTDIFDGQHSRAFVVAGAMKDDLLVDLRTAVDKAIAGGTTIEEFRRDFDKLVSKHGWVYNGGRNWRTRVIFDTNLNSSYMAGRWQQLQAVSKTRPFWRYVHSDFVDNPRLNHLAWNGLVLAHDDEFWSTHFPPNGWGCKCRVESLSKKDLARAGKSGPDQAPPVELETRVVGTRGPAPRTVEVPKGIDPGFGYNVGEAAYGRQLADDVMDTWRAQGAQAWESLTPKTWKDFGRSKTIPADAAKAAVTSPVATPGEVVDRLQEVLGGEEKVFDVKGLPVAVNAVSLAAHLEDLARSSYVSLLPEMLNDPFEVWLSFDQHKATNLVVLRTRIIKVVQLDRQRALMLVANAVGGRLEAWTFVPTSNVNYLQNSRRGELIYGR